ncbi:tetratricopeptide repeat protein [Neolewinella litorea]|uniref:Tetratricopeptide repeat protein n=1 Tax=Neolewinella litorea TaxID=2562452 RepID=A0A4S4NMK0_9BACT|nr:hypothetical protein [Neolewinella litorea]THH41042.1 hypothetical protein E4021_00150 [Neolewinella litorea]
MAPIRPLLLILALACSFPALADNLDGRLRLLFPGDAPTEVSERRVVEKGLENIFRQLRYSDKADRKSTKKQIALIRERLHRQVLRQYDPGADLADAFRDGTYNDATAVLLLALTLEQFQIPYEGYVDHWESYLLADPAGQRVELRHPAARPHDPQNALRYRREYLSLVRQTVEEDLTGLDDAQADSIFFRYYYRPDRRLTFLQLSAYQQFRLAQHAYANGQFPQVKARLDEASIRENRRAFQVLADASHLQQSSLKQPDAEGYITGLFELWREDATNGYLAATLLRHFDERQQALLEAAEVEAARRLLDRYAERRPAGRDDWKAELELLQQLRLLNHYQASGEIDAALHLAQNLYQSQPDNSNFQHYLAELTLVQLRREYTDPDELVERAAAVAEQYPFMAENDRYADILLRQRALRIRDLFAAGEEGRGLEELKAFREQLAATPQGNDRALWTLTAFVAASNYYFGERNYAPARAYIEEALQFDPENDFLLHQQDLLSRY